MRVFVAVEISNKEVIRLIKKFQSELNLKAKPVEPQNLHFTLQFLGEITEEVSKEIRNALKTIQFSSFKVNFKGTGVFPKMKFPRVIWIGTDNVGANALTDLANKVQQVLSPLGFTPDKPFKSHITVFRIKNKISDISREMEKFGTNEFGSQIITNFKLKQSVLTPQGPVYSDIEEIKSKP